MNGTGDIVFKRCGCTDAGTGRQLAGHCPHLAEPGHGSWYYGHIGECGSVLYLHRLRIPRSAQAGQVCLAGPPDPLPGRGEPVVPGGRERADRDRDQAGQRIDPALR
jgi:hypothetical protein